MPLLEVTGLRRRFGARVALDDVSLRAEPGRVHALVGENGAGKSTLIRCVCGLDGADAGEVRVDGAALPVGDPRAAMRAGVGVVHQHFMLAGALSAVDNVALGVEPRRGPLGLLVDRGAARRDLAALAEARAMPVDLDAPVASLTVGERQRVEILKVLYRGATALLLDEPTAVLSPAEVRSLLATVRALADGGASVVIVTHKLDEVFAVADEVTALRRGRVVLHAPLAELTPEKVAKAVVGDGAVHTPAPRAAAERSGEGLALDAVEAPGLGPVSLRVERGEVLGVAGVEGNGQRALAEVIAGIVRPTRGAVRLGGEEVSAEGVAARRAKGLGYVPEDREGRGLFAELTVAENLALGEPEVVTGRGRFDVSAARARATTLVARFGVRPADVDAPVSSLSGGNQQKVLMARELSRALVALVVAQPTRGVDLGAAAELREAIREARAAGAAVVLVSAELDELRALADRVAVMRGGRIVGEVAVSEATDERLGGLMVGATVTEGTDLGVRGR
ncbi:MAG: ABC transporter ATP-binding protein [Polyangiales bacterium]